MIRIQNLLIIAFTQYVVRWCIVYPIIQLNSKYYTLQLSELNFFLLVLSTVMIAASGYIINDYFDVRIDKVNKPERLVIDKGVKRRVEMGAHSVINVLAIILALYVSYSIGSWRLTLVHFICAGGLWFYSTTFKRQFLIGNIVIAAFTALVPLIAVIYDMIPIYRTYLPIEETLSFMAVWEYTVAFSFFAFITTLLREIIKDMEDVDGDEEYGCKTMPIVLGIEMTKKIVMAIAFITMICLAMIQKDFLKIDDKISFIYFTIALQLPLAFLIYKIKTAQEKTQLRFAGNLAKFIMLLGIIYLLVFAYPILHNTLHAI
ncbi:MAG: geranylgeranylglycerol-phosphate geranylgeranyltransferase [Bacteroidetes bacterium]|nr:geranylgeranylglycerol-phosphate geranylgeranyltransferase [Bacteroidota bacterium]